MVLHCFIQFQFWQLSWLLLHLYGKVLPETYHGKTGRFQNHIGSGFRFEISNRSVILASNLLIPLSSPIRNSDTLLDLMNIVNWQEFLPVYLLFVPLSSTPESKQSSPLHNQSSATCDKETSHTSLSEIGTEPDGNR